MIESSYIKNELLPWLLEHPDVFGWEVLGFIESSRHKWDTDAISNSDANPLQGSASTKIPELPSKFAGDCWHDDSCESAINQLIDWANAINERMK